MISLPREDMRKDIFISYSRKQLLFANRLYQYLSGKGFSVWFDQNDIPMAVDFLSEIERGIQQSHYFFFLLSPDSAGSIYCSKEVECAVEYGKRIIPIHCMPTKGDEVDQLNPVIKRLNWINGLVETEDAYHLMTEDICALLHTGIEQSRLHTELICHALRWKTGLYADKFLLKGKLRDQAEKWLQKTIGDLSMESSYPTDFLCEYICESRKSAMNGVTDALVFVDSEDNKDREQIIKTLARHGVSTLRIELNSEGQKMTDDLHESIQHAESIVFILPDLHYTSSGFLTVLEYAHEWSKRIFILTSGEFSETSLSSGTKNTVCISIDKNETEGILILLRELKNEKNYYSRQRDLLVNALRWNKNQKNSLLLAGKELEFARSWMHVSNGKHANKGGKIIESYIQKSIVVNTDFSCEVYLVASLEDVDFGQKICRELRLNDCSAFLSTEADILPENTAVFSDYLSKSDNLLLLFTPHLVSTGVIQTYIELAAKFEKRIILFINSEVSETDIPKDLLANLPVNYLQYDEDFSIEFAELLTLLSFDREYIMEHTRWLRAAELWMDSEQSSDFLPRGKILLEASCWLDSAEKEEKKPVPTQLQKDFIAFACQYEKEEEDLDLKRENYLKELEFENQSLKEAEERIGIVEGVSGNLTESVIFPDISQMVSRKDEFEQIVRMASEAGNGKNVSVLMEEDEGSCASVLSGNIAKYFSAAEDVLYLECTIMEETGSPYAALANMISELTTELLRNKSDLSGLRLRLEAALHGNGKVLLDIMPHLELLMGVQPPVLDLDLFRTKQRLKISFSAFMDAIRQQGQTSVLFVKNLHNASQELRDLLFHLVSPAAGLERFLFIGLCSSDTPELEQLIQQWNGNEEINRIRLQNLSKSTLENQFAELFQVSAFSCTDLLDALYEKTDGNPAMLLEVLNQMYEKSQIQWNVDKHTWDWEIIALEQIDIVKNVEERAKIALQRLTKDQNQILTVAACIGMQFSYDMLSLTFKKAFNYPMSNLVDLIHERLLIPASDSYKHTAALKIDLDSQRNLYFRFASSHLRKASIRSADPDHLKLIRLEIGKQFLKKLKGAATADIIYNTATYINESIDLLHGRKLKMAAAECNFMAGELSLRSSAFQSAFFYLSKGLEHLKAIENYWEIAYELSFKLHLLHAKSSFYCGDAKITSKEMESLIQHAKGDEDKATCYIVYCNALQSTGNAKESLAYAYEGLKMLGVRFPALEEYETETNRLYNLLTEDKIIQQLEEMPVAVENQCLIGELYRVAIISVYFVEPQNLGWICSRSLEHAYFNGATYGTRQSMAWFSMILMMKGDYELSFQYAEIAIDTSVKNTDSQLARGQTAMISRAMSLSWKYAFSETEEALKPAFNQCQNNGDPQYASYILIVIYIAKLMQADDLPKLLKYCQNWQDHCAHFAPLELGQARIRTALLKKLMGIELSESIDYEAIIREYELSNNHTDVCESLLELARISFLFNDYEESLMYCKRAESMIQSGAAGSLLLNLLYYQVYASCCAKIYLQRIQDEQSFFAQQYEQKGEELLSNLRFWAEVNPDNFEVYYLLAQADWAAAKADEALAIPLYHKLALHKRKFDYPLLRALAFEGLAKFCHTLNYSIARIHAEDAILTYAECGALGKARQLEMWLNSEQIYQAIAYSKGLKKVDENLLIRAMLTISSSENKEHLISRTLHSMRDLSKTSKIVLLKPDNGMHLRIQAGFDDGDIQLNAAWEPNIDIDVMKKTLDKNFELPKSYFSLLEQKKKNYQQEAAFVLKLEHCGECVAVLYAEPVNKRFSDAQKKILRVLGEQYAHLSVN